jgi:hypothetical protein
MSERKRIVNLLHQYLREQPLSDAEKDELLLWASKSPYNNSLLHEVTDTRALELEIKRLLKSDIRKAWEKVNTRLD